jgi:histone demethylase JARID1
MLTCIRYHGRCLKIARGKVKEDDKYTCPICDYRVKIPRDAARPKLEDLQGWQDEIPNLPFQPEEEDCLNRILDSAQDFRASIATLINPMMSTPDDLSVQRFYLRKIEGADVLLTTETNFLRQELHKWAPVAPEPPKLIDVSLSTRKPRPTKQQKMMQQLGITDPNELPEHLRPKLPKHKKSTPGRTGSGPSSVVGPSTGQRSDTPPGHPKDSAAAEPGSAPRYGYDPVSPAVPSPAFQQNSPMFSTGNNPFSASDLAAASGLRVASPAAGGIDPQLENMFAQPSTFSPGDLGDSREATVGIKDPDTTAVGNSQDERDLFNSLTNGDTEGGYSTFGGHAPELEEPAESYP